MRPADDVLVDLVDEDDEPEHPHRLAQQRGQQAASRRRRCFGGLAHAEGKLLADSTGMGQIAMFIALAAAAVAVAFVLRRRRRPAPPTQPRTTVPSQLDRRDFERPEAPWLVAVFSSATCLSCAGTWEKARQLESASSRRAGRRSVSPARPPRALRDHGVPIVVVADGDGVVRAAFVGPPTATDLWATLAELREPGSTPSGCDHHGSAASR